MRKAALRSCPLHTLQATVFYLFVKKSNAVSHQRIATFSKPSAVIDARRTTCACASASSKSPSATRRSAADALLSSIPSKISFIVIGTKMLRFSSKISCDAISFPRSSDFGSVRETDFPSFETVEAIFETSAMPARATPEYLTML